MTENKRFRISQGYTDRFCHDWQNNQLLNFRETVELLNELAEENKELKEKLEYGQCHMCGARLKYGGIEMNKELLE